MEEPGVPVDPVEPVYPVYPLKYSSIIVVMVVLNKILILLFTVTLCSIISTMFLFSVKPNSVSNQVGILILMNVSNVLDEKRLSLILLDGFLEENQEFIDWKLLSENDEAIDLLSKNINKIHWRNLSSNTSVDVGTIP